VNDYLAAETLGALKMQELHRDAAMAVLAAQIGRNSRPVYRVFIAALLRKFALRLDPTCSPLTAVTR
jgi:hypothetical protein